jgi:hypothetical protein
LQTIVVCQGDAGPIDSLLINLDICFILWYDACPSLNANFAWTSEKFILLS